MNDMIQEPNTTFPHSKTTESRRVSNATYLLVVVVALSNKNIFSTKKLFYTKEKSSCSILLLL